MSNKSKRGFVWSTKAWYRNIMDGKNICFGLYYDDGSTDGEMYMEWIDLNQKVLFPQLQVFDDAWKVLNSFSDLLIELAKVDSKNITEEQFVEILLRCGFEDLTEYRRINHECR